MVSRHRVVDHIITQLAASGIEYIFGVDGANIEDLYDAAFLRDDITAILAKHEFSAATMADGYSRAVSRIGVGAATSGGGSLNLIAGLGESLTSRVPVLALVDRRRPAWTAVAAFRTPVGAPDRSTRWRCSRRCRCTAAA